MKSSLKRSLYRFACMTKRARFKSVRHRSCLPERGDVLSTPITSSPWNSGISTERKPSGTSSSGAVSIVIVVSKEMSTFPFSTI